MAEVTSTKYTTPNTVKYANSGSDRFRRTHVAGWMENLDGHDHDTNKGDPVKRLQTSTTPTAAGHVQVNTDDMTWWGSSAAAVQTAVRTSGTQTIAGSKTFSSAGNTFSNGLTITAGGFLVSAGGANITGNATLNNNLTVTGTTTFTGQVNTPVFVGDTSNAQSANGMTLNQGASDDEILTFKSSDVAHGMTLRTETDSYGFVKKYNANNGGLYVEGDADGGSVGVFLFGAAPTDDTTRSTSAVGYVMTQAGKTSGTDVGAPGANANLFVVQGNGAQFLVDAEGDIHMNATSNINAWDEHDDLALLEAFRVTTANPANYRLRFAKDVDAHARVLHETGVITLNADGNHFVSMKGMLGLLIDALRQTTARVQLLEEQNRRMLEAPG